LHLLQGFAGGLLALVGEIIYGQSFSGGDTEDAHLEDICLAIGDGGAGRFVEDSLCEGGAYAQVAAREIGSLVGDEVKF